MQNKGPDSGHGGFAEKIRARFREELLEPKDTLRNNEVQANLFTAKVMLGTAILCLVLLLSALLNLIPSDSRAVPWFLISAAVLMGIPAVLCLRRRGEKKGTMFLLLISYVLGLALAELALTQRVILCLAIPVILSIRYYSGILTVCTGLLTTLVFLLSSGLSGVFRQGNGNLVLPGILLLLITLICAMIADWGRILIFGELEETKKAERLAMELNLAKSIQANMVPNIFPAFPERTEFDVYARMEPAKELGGDFFDFQMIDRDHLAVIIADVSGKGIPAAMFMMASKSMINNIAKNRHRDPARILQTANRQISASNASEMFVTLWLGILEISTGKLTAANAGHEYPCLKQDEEGFRILKDKHGLVLGAMDDIEYKSYEIQLKPGDTIFLYTDGVTEATNTENELFGEQRMLDALNYDAETSSAQILDNVRRAISSFTKGAEQADDITMIALKYFGKEGKNMPEE